MNLSIRAPVVNARFEDLRDFQTVEELEDALANLPDTAGEPVEWQWPALTTKPEPSPRFTSEETAAHRAAFVAAFKDAAVVGRRDADERIQTAEKLEEDTVFDLVQAAEDALSSADNQIAAEEAVTGLSSTRATLEGRYSGLRKALDELLYRSDYVNEARSIADAYQSGKKYRSGSVGHKNAVLDVRNRVAEVQAEGSATQNPVLAKKQAILHAIGSLPISRRELTRRTQFLSRRERDDLLADLVVARQVRIKIDPAADGGATLTPLSTAGIADPQLDAARQQYLSRLLPRLERWELAPLGVPVPQDVRIVRQQAKEFDLQPIAPADFAESDFPLSYLVNDVLVEGQPCVIGGAQKSLKTTLAIALAVSLGSGVPFLGKFSVPKKVRSLFISGESGGATIRSTAMGISRSHMRMLRDVDVHWAFNVPQLGLTSQLKNLAEYVSDLGVGVAFVDPIYLAMMRKDDGQPINFANVFEVGEVLRQISETFAEVGCTPVLLHHASKSAARTAGNAGMSLSDLSMAGFAEWARQWMLLCRRQEFAKADAQRHELWMTIGGSAGHHSNWALDASLGPVIGAIGGRDWDVAVRPAEDVREEESSRKSSEKLTAAERKTLEKRKKLVSHLQRNPEGATARSLQDASGLRGEKFQDVINSLLDSGEIQSTKVQTAGGKYAGYRLAVRPVDPDMIDREFPIDGPTVLS